MCLNNNEIKSDTIGWQVAIDCYDCNLEIANDIEKIKEIIQKICNMIGAQIVLDDYYLFKPYGISAYAIITTSHVSVHTWPEYKFVAVDIFSCAGKTSKKVVDFIQQYFEAKSINVTYFERGKQRKIDENNIVEF